jgi:PAS domain S-box-containing protein
MNNTITKLMRYLLLLGVIIFLALVIFPLIAGRRGALSSLKAQEQQTNLTVSRALVHAYWTELEHLLLDTDASPLDMSGLEQAFDELLEGSIVKINLFDREGVTVYSTDAGIIGAKEVDNENLVTAFKGEVSQEFERYSLIEEGRSQDIQLLSVYVPLHYHIDPELDHDTESYQASDYHDSNEVIGVLELYSNVTPQIQSINRAQLGIAVSTTVLLLLIYGSAFFFLRKATKTVADKQQQLERYAHLVRHTPTILFEVTKAGRVIYLNPSAKKRFPELDSSDLSGSEALQHPLLTGWESITSNLQPGATFERELAISGRVYMQRVSYNEGSQNYDIYIHDVTLQKRSEEGLRRAQSEQRALLDAIPDMMFVADKNGVLLECKVDEKHGDIQQLIGYNFKDLGVVPTDIANLFDEAGRGVLEKQRPRELEYNLMNEKGERVFYEARVIPLAGERVMSLVRDVTQRKTQDLALQESEARNRSLIAGFPDLIFVVDKTGTFLEVQLDDEHPLMEPLVGRNFSEISFIPEETAHMLKGFVRRAIATRALQVAEYSLPSLGRVSDYEARFIALDDERVLYIARDVSERKRREEALRESEAQVKSLLEAIPDMVFVMSREGTYLDIKLDKTHGLIEELVGRNVRNLGFMAREIAEGIVEKLQKASASSETQTLEYSLEGNIKGVRRLAHYEARFVPIDSEKILMLVRDMTQRHDDEMTLQTLTKEAQRHTKELLLLDKVRTVATQELELKDMIRKSVNVIAETFDYTLVSIYLLESRSSETQDLVMQHQVGYKTFIERLPLDKGVMGKVARTGQSILLKNPKEDSDVVWAFDGINSEICVPLLDTGRVVGVLNVESTEKRFFDEADLQLMTALSDTLGVAIERARLYSETRLREAEYKELYGHSNQQALELARRNDELALLDNVRSALLGQLELKEFYRSVVEAVSKHLGYPCAFICEVKEDTFRLAYQIGYATSDFSMPITEGLCGRVLRTGAAVLVPDVREDPDYVSVQDTILSGVYVPFYYNGVVKGVLSVETLREPKVELTQHDLELLSSLSDMITLGITRVQLYSELKTNEERYRELIENASDIIYRIDLRGYFTYTNSVVKRLLGYDETNVIGRNYLELVRPDYRQEMQDFYIGQLKENLATTYLEFPALDVNGQEVWIGQNVSLVKDQGRLVGMQAVARDITERKRMEEALLQQAEELSSANADLEQFAFIAAHDLQEPLRKIQAFGDRLNLKYKNVLDDTGRDYLERMRSSATRMRTLIDDLLSFARANKQQQRSLVSLETIVRGVLGDLQVRIEETQATISVGVLPTLEVDPSQFRQVFQNLLSNALKFRKPDVAPVITVYSHRLGTGDWELRFSDNGIGFEEQYKERIFAVFQRLHSREQYEGTGIGLAIVRRIIESHEGTIEVSSRLGEGTTFSITLPGVAKIATEDSPETVLA